MRLAAAAGNIWTHLRRHHLYYLVAASFLVQAFLIAVEALATRRSFVCYYADGCFQLLNPLRRLSAGQVLGVDFQFFYGVGTLLAHYPIFYLFGGNLFASTMSHLITPLFLFLAEVVIVALMFGFRFRQALLAAALATVAIWSSPILMAAVAGKHYGIRAFFPFLAVGIIYRSFRTEYDPGHLGGDAPAGRWRQLLAKAASIGLVLGLSVFVSFDVGLPALLAGIFAILSAAPFRFRNMVISAVAGLTAAAVAGLSLLLTCGRGWLSVIRYGLIDTPGDQMWYFGVWPNRFFGNWADLLAGWRTAGPVLSLALSVSLLAGYLAVRKPAARPTAVFLGIFGLASLLPILGISQHRHYLFIAWCCLILLAVVWLRDGQAVSRLRLSSLFKRSASAVPAASAGGRPAVAQQFSLVSAAPALLLVAWIVCSMIEAPAVIPQAAADGVDARFGVTFSAPWNELNRQADELRSRFIGQGIRPRLWSVYASAPEIAADAFNPDADYLIHALGPAGRQRYVDRFRSTRPDIVRTENPEFTYASWLWRENWPFYESLAANYEPVASVQYGVFWIRPPGDDRQPFRDGGEWRDLTVVDGREIILPPAAGEPVPVTVSLTYEVDNPYRRLPLVSGLPRIFLFPSETVGSLPTSLPPQGTEFVTVAFLRGSGRDALGFPGRQAGGGEAENRLADLSPSSSLRVGVRSLLPGVSARIVSARWRPVPFSDADREFFYRPSTNL